MKHRESRPLLAHSAGVSVGLPDSNPKLSNGEKAIAANLYAALRPWHNKSAYVIPIASKSGKAFGNNGDKLLMCVFWHILHQADVRTTDDIKTADVLIVPPSGSLLEMYAFPELLREYTSANLHVPLLIFPSSASFPTKNPAFMFEDRTSKTTLVLREEYSFNHMQHQWGESLAAVNCELVLDHDVVASHKEFVRSLFGSVRNGRPLVGARKDIEQNAMVTGEQSSPSWVSDTFRTARAGVTQTAMNRIPYGRGYTSLGRAVRSKAQQTAGARLIQQLPDEERARFNSRHVIHRDASSTYQATFGQYLRTIAGAGPVLTDRLHIALPAAILGKDVWLVEGGYHKARGVVERSLTGVPNLRLVLPSFNSAP